MTGPTRTVRKLVLTRDQGCCVRCGGEVYDIDADRLYQMYSLQHRAPRGMGGTKSPVINSPANLVTLCGSGTTGCHGWVESHREESRLYGWAVSRYQSPDVVPMLHAYQGWVLVSDSYDRLAPQAVWALAEEWMSQDPTRTAEDARRVFGLDAVGALGRQTSRPHGLPTVNLGEDQS